MAVYTLENTIMEYDWGDPDQIPQLLGVPNPERTPKAELWMGAHPSAPSKIVELSGRPLDEAIRDDPGAFLGAAAADRHDTTLPFLFKVLAAGKPLSIQTHPDKKQAEAGFRRENEAGIPLDAPQRNYKDSNHKPEIICALTPFWALRGFRPPEEMWNLLSPVAEGVVAEALAALEDSKNEAGIRGFFQRFLSADSGSLGEGVTATVDRIRRGGSAAGMPQDEIRWVGELAAAYPGDSGVLCPLILNLIRLEPGQAMYLPAGELHAYLQGLGMELMANSDNVLRGGLTAKHVDVPELLRTLHFEGRKPEILLPDDQASGAAVYRIPTDEFSLSRITLAGGSAFRGRSDRSLEIILCYEGTCLISAGTADMAAPRRLEAGKGTSLLLPASSGEYTITGRGTLYKAAVP
jgi:mannose-6-phosphate isomerase